MRDLFSCISLYWHIYIENANEKKERICLCAWCLACSIIIFSLSQFLFPSVLFRSKRQNCFCTTPTPRSSSSSSSVQYKTEKKTSIGGSLKLLRQRKVHQSNVHPHHNCDIFCLMQLPNTIQTFSPAIYFTMYYKQSHALILPLVI